MISNWTIDHLERLHLLWAVLGVLVLGVYALVRKQRARRALADAALLGRLMPPVSWVRAVSRIALLTLALIALTGALLGPRWGVRTETVVQRDVEVMVLLDVSRSMLARDISPSRLERAKLSISDDLLPALGGERVGLITFAGTPALACPLTDDYGFFRLALEDVGIASAGRGGTLIGDALRRAKDAFKSKLDTNKAILLITDGEDQASAPKQAAAGLWEEGRIPIVAVVLGDPQQGARIPVNDEGTRFLEYEGETVVSKADFSTLRAVAEAGGGELFAARGRENFIPVGTKDFDLGQIYTDVILPVLEFEENQVRRELRQPSQAHWFAAAALLLVLIDSFLRDGPRPGRLAKLEPRGGTTTLHEEQAA